MVLVVELLKAIRVKQLNFLLHGMIKCTGTQTKSWVHKYKQNSQIQVISVLVNNVFAKYVRRAVLRVNVSMLCLSNKFTRHSTD
jgi:hypothetical protein